MEVNQLKGYLLEDAVQKLLEVNGYDIITETGFNIEKLHNGLNIVGRSAYYPFNSLGQLKWTPPFSNPIRLFVEAKFRKNKVGVDLVREAIGVLADINQNYSTVQLDKSQLNLSIFEYHYLIFSSSGFTDEAYRMAVAHKIYLIDVSGERYDSLVRSIENFIRIASENFGDEDFIPNENAYFIRDIFRKAIELPNQTREVENLFLNTPSDSIYLTEEGIKVKENIEQIGGIYLATTDVPFLIGLIANDDQKFRTSLLKQAKQRVKLTWVEEKENWGIVPENNTYFLEFTLPEIIENYLFSTKLDDSKIIPSINFIADLKNDNNPQLYTLEYELQLLES